MGGNNQGMDYFLWAVVAVSQLLVGFLGILAIKSDFAGQHFKSFVAAFIVLSIIGLIASGWGVVRATNASNEIARLQKDTLYAVQGSPDSFLEIHPNFNKGEGGDYDKGIMAFSYYNDSEYPMMDTIVGINGVRNIEYPKYGRRIGDVYSKRGGTLPGLTVQLSKEKDVEIDFYIQSRSTLLFETMVVTWNGKAWVIDWSLKREDQNKDPTEVTILRKFRDDFPFKDGPPIE
jgi:hypothetical protein